MGFVWVHADSFLHRVASPFYSFVTTFWVSLKTTGGFGDLSVASSQSQHPRASRRSRIRDSWAQLAQGTVGARMSAFASMFERSKSGTWRVRQDRGAPTLRHTFARRFKVAGAGRCGKRTLFARRLCG